VGVHTRLRGLRKVGEAPLSNEVDIMAKPVCAVIGIGPGNGAALARRFGKDHRVALLSRSTDMSKDLAAELGDARAYACDVGDRASVDRAFNAIAKDLGAVDVLVYNAGSGTWGNVEEITPDQFETSYRINAEGLLVSAQKVIPAMKQKGKGAIVVIGATASRRGGVMTAAFAPAKAAQRSLAESMAKHLGPSGIHVAVIIIDGMVDLPRTRERMPDKSDDFFVKPDDVAATAHWLAEQPRSAWSFEVEARPFMEKW
jgi:NAD(P)-dependent dehydrogenase (short-subunit alcohol dehydrogenase family)